jgi:hypothetical protein
MALMSVRAKFKLSGVKTEAVGTADGKENIVYTLEFRTVSQGDEKLDAENKVFWKYSPGGSISLNCINPGAMAQFEIGKFYYVDFSQAPA